MPERHEVLAALPKQTRALWNDIEAFSKIAIGVEAHPNPPQISTRVTHTEASILLGEIEDIDVVGVAHELLHIHRFWNEQVPQLRPINDTPQGWTICSNLDNVLEHLIIVPREADYGGDASKWNDAARRNWSDEVWRNIHDVFDRRNFALLEKLSLRLVDDDEIVEAANARLAKLDLTAVADQFDQDIQKRLADKPGLASCAQHYLQFRADFMQLAYLDVRNREVRTHPIQAFLR